MTDDVHPEVAARAVDAARRWSACDICGVDMVCDSVLRPLEEQHGGVVEVNAAPGLRMHLSPSFGKRPRGRRSDRSTTLFADGDDGRIPVVAVTGTNGKTTTARLIAHLLGRSGLRTGMTNTDGVYIEGRRIDSGDCSGPKSARNVLLHPDVDAAVFETARGGMLREGLGFDRCQVAVVTNIGSGDHLGLNYITTRRRPGGAQARDRAERGRRAARRCSTRPIPIVAAMAANCPGSVIFFAADRHHPGDGHAPRAGQARRLRRPGRDLVAAEGSWRERIAAARRADHAQRHASASRSRT